MFLCTFPFVALTGFGAMKEWFRRQDSFDTGALGTVTPTSALLVELRQRQIIAVLNRAGTSATLPSEVDREGSMRAEKGATASPTPQLDLTPVDEMYEQAMAGPLCGPLLRVFLAQYIRYYVGNHHLEFMQLRILESMSTPIDVSFFVAQRLYELKQLGKLDQTNGGEATPQAIS